MRLFIGMKVPDGLRQAIQRSAEDLPLQALDCRPIDPDKWHFTLAFLGEVEPTHLQALHVLIGHAVKRAPHGDFQFTSFETFPSRHPSYVVARAQARPEREWVEFIERLRDLVSVAAPHIDRKPWIPHVSIARSRKGKLLSAWSRGVEPFVWRPTEMTLVHSQPAPHGSTYTDLHVYPFNI